MIEIPMSERDQQRCLNLPRAAYDLLKTSDNAGYVMETAGIETFYDGANCDGSCLMQDIADHLDLPGGINTDPLPLQSENSP